MKILSWNFLLLCQGENFENNDTLHATTTHCTLHATHYTLHATLYTLLTNQYTLLTTRYTLHATHYTLLSTRYSLITTRYSLHATRYTLHSTRYIAKCLYNALRAMNSDCCRSILQADTSLLLPPISPSHSSFLYSPP